MRCFGLIMTLLLCVSTLDAQNYGELKREEFGDGLYKVQSGNYYGVFDDKDNVIVSVEYYGHENEMYKYNIEVK